MRTIQQLSGKESICQDVEVFDETLHELIDRLTRTLHATDGVGLSAPQIGVNKKVTVLDFQDGREPLELINPVLVRYFGEATEMEGCLSYRGIYGEVTRPEAIQVEAQDRNGDVFEITAESFEARAILHEMDHLVGVPFEKKLKNRVTEEQFDALEEDMN